MLLLADLAQDQPLVKFVQHILNLLTRQWSRTCSGCYVGTEQPAIAMAGRQCRWKQGIGHDRTCNRRRWHWRHGWRLAQQLVHDLWTIIDQRVLAWIERQGVDRLDALHVQGIDANALLVLHNLYVHLPDCA